MLQMESREVIGHSTELMEREIFGAGPQPFDLEMCWCRKQDSNL
jgi:hypothetical protein